MASFSIIASDGTEFLLDQDAALPEQGFDVGVSLRTVETWYPDVGTPSVQIMGTKEEPIALKGLWRDDMLALAGGAEALINIGRQLVLRQVPAQLVWYTDDGRAPLTRDVLVKSFVGTVRRADAYGWAMTVQPLSATESEVIAVPSTPIANPYALAAVLRALIVAAEAAAEAAIIVSNVLQAVL